MDNYGPQYPVHVPDRDANGHTPFSLARLATATACQHAAAPNRMAALDSDSRYYDGVAWRCFACGSAPPATVGEQCALEVSAVSGAQKYELEMTDSDGDTQVSEATTIAADTPTGAIERAIATTRAWVRGGYWTRDCEVTAYWRLFVCSDSGGRLIGEGSISVSVKRTAICLYARPRPTV